MTTPPPPDAPVLRSRDLYIAAGATSALFDSLLVKVGIPFETSIVLNMAHAADPEGVPLSDVVERFTVDVRRPADAVPGYLDGARLAGLVEGDDPVRLTDAGRQIQDQIDEHIADVVARVYADLDVEDLVVARRVVDQVTAQARAELARRSAA